MSGPVTAHRAIQPKTTSKGKDASAGIDRLSFWRREDTDAVLLSPSPAKRKRCFDWQFRPLLRAPALTRVTGSKERKHDDQDKFNQPAAKFAVTALQAILSNPKDLTHVKKLTTDDFTYVSLNYDNGARPYPSAEWSHRCCRCHSSGNGWNSSS